MGTDALSPCVVCARMHKCTSGIDGAHKAQQGAHVGTLTPQTRSLTIPHPFQTLKKVLERVPETLAVSPADPVNVMLV